MREHDLSIWYIISQGLQHTGKRQEVSSDLTAASARLCCFLTPSLGNVANSFFFRGVPFVSLALASILYFFSITTITSKVLYCLAITVTFANPDRVPLKPILQQVRRPLSTSQATAASRLAARLPPPTVSSELHSSKSGCCRILTAGLNQSARDK